MHNFVGVTVCHGTQELFHVIFCFIFSNHLIFNNPLEKLAATTVFHNDVYENFFDVDFMDSDDVGMILNELGKENTSFLSIKIYYNSTIVLSFFNTLLAALVIPVDRLIALNTHPKEPLPMAGYSKM